MLKHWVLVGDKAGVKVYESDVLLEELTLADELTLAHAHVAHDADRFVRAVAKLVNDAESQHRFERLILAAPPHFLGDVREHLSHNAQKRVVASIHHDWTHLGAHDLSAHVRKSLPATAGMP